MVFMHIYMKYNNPLLIQSILPVKSAFELSIVKIHVFGMEANGELKRPFKVVNMFGAGQDETQPEKVAIKEE